MKTVSSRALRQQIRAKLSPTYDQGEADLVSARLIEHLFRITATHQLIDSKLEISPEINSALEAMIKRLRNDEPLQHVLGYTEFYGRKFKTDFRALIPRPETEELVHLALEYAFNSQSTILDIGTGTGCIAITLALETGAQVFALDTESEALALARENATSLNAIIHFVQADILVSEPEIPKLDAIVSNPPYVPQSDFGSLDNRVKSFEPGTALFVPDQDPLLFYKRIAYVAPLYLKPGGSLFLEIYHTAGPAVMQLFQGSHWSQVSLKKDLQGKDRMVMATFVSDP